MQLLRLSVAVLLALTVVQGLPADDLLEKYRAPAMEKWSAEMKRIELLDARETDPAAAVLFLGSSSIRLWEDIASDLTPWPVIARGYGGAKFSDLAVLAEQVIKPHTFRAVVIFVGNDVTGGKDDKTPQEVVQLFEHVVSTVRRQAAATPIFLIEITPTPKRWAVWEKIVQVNAALRESCKAGEDMHFIATAQHYLDADGQPRPNLFKEDQLHQNREGYKIWSRLIRAELESVLKEPTAKLTR